MGMFDFSTNATIANSPVNQSKILALLSFLFLLVGYGSKVVITATGALNVWQNNATYITDTYSTSLSFSSSLADILTFSLFMVGGLELVVYYFNMPKDGEEAHHRDWLGFGNGFFTGGIYFFLSAGADISWYLIKPQVALGLYCFAVLWVAFAYWMIVVSRYRETQREKRDVSWTKMVCIDLPQTVYLYHCIISIGVATLGWWMVAPDNKFEDLVTPWAMDLFGALWFGIAIGLPHIFISGMIFGDPVMPGVIFIFGICHGFYQINIHNNTGIVSFVVAAAAGAICLLKLLNYWKYNTSSSGYKKI